MIRRNRKAIATALVCANLLFIWVNSLLPASVSASFSGWVKSILGFLMNGTDTLLQGEGILRKFAHFLEFCSFGALLGWRISMNRKNKWILLTFGLGVSVACVDEMLQHFAPGRAPRITDVGIDTSGVLLGIGLLILGKHIRKKKQNNKFGG